MSSSRPQRSRGGRQQHTTAIDVLIRDLDLGEGRSMAVLLTVRGLATLLFRMSQRLGDRHPTLGHLLKQLNHVLTGADLSWQAQIGPGIKLFHPTGVVIGPDVVVGENCALQQGVTLGALRERGRVVDGRVDSPRLGDDVVIGAGARVLGPITVGDRCVVGANAVVVRDAPPDSLLTGVPAHGREHDR